MVECLLWEQDVAGSSPVSSTSTGGCMKEHDKLPHIIAGIALILYLVFVSYMIKEPQELQGGDIEKAIQTEQYR